MEKYKLILQKGSQRINSLIDWQNIAPPKRKDLHWKDGRSAKELAKYILSSNGNIPKEIEKILDGINCSENIQFIGEPEAVTQLVGTGMGRNHDLLLKSDDIVIGIEAKADESLGKLVREELENNISNNKRHRIESMYKFIYGNEDLERYNPRYQLLTAAVGTLIEAEKINARKAMLLIITFKKNGCYKEEKVKSTIENIDYFLNTLNKSLSGGKYNLPGYISIDFYIKHLIIEC